MSIVTNNHREPLGLPNGTVLQPGVATPVHGWHDIRKNFAVGAWLQAGVLTAVEAGTDDQGSQFVQPDKAELQAKLDALGVAYDKRMGVAKLVTLLIDAEAAAALAAQLAARVETAAIEASGKTAEEFAALPDDERAAALAAAAEALQG